MALAAEPFHRSSDVHALLLLLVLLPLLLLLLLLLLSRRLACTCRTSCLLLPRVQQLQREVQQRGTRQRVGCGGRCGRLLAAAAANVHFALLVIRCRACVGLA